MSSYHGRRYLTAQEFRSHCSDLSVEVDAFYHDLERYERDRILPPVARLIKPSEYMEQRRNLDANAETWGQPVAGWDELEDLIHHRSNRKSDRPEDRWHPFDRAIKYENRFLLAPVEGEFKDWRAYWREGFGVEHYYHYWQVHQVYAIHRYYPVYANDAWLLDNLKDEAKERAIRLIPLPNDPRINLKGNIHFFDALSFFVQLYENEHFKVFGFDKPETNEMHQVFEERLTVHAKFILQLYSIEIPQLYQFVFYLLDLRSDYRRNEQEKLVDAVEQDLVFAVNLICYATNQTLQDVAEEAGRLTSPFVRQDIRALDDHLEMRDYTQEAFSRVLKDYNELLPEFQVSMAEIEELLGFIDSTGLLLIPYTIFETDKALNSKKPIHKSLLYIAMKNLATGLEELLREIAKRSDHDKSWGTLDNLIQELFGDWYPLFQEERKRKPIPSRPSEFIEHINAVSKDDTLGNNSRGRVVRIFLIAYWARNLTGHYYTLEGDLYGGLSGNIITAIYYAFLFSWKKAHPLPQINDHQEAENDSRT